MTPLISTIFYWDDFFINSDSSCLLSGFKLDSYGDAGSSGCDYDDWLPGDRTNNADDTVSLGHVDYYRTYGIGYKFCFRAWTES